MIHSFTLFTQSWVEVGRSGGASRGRLSLLVHWLLLQVALGRVIAHKEGLIVKPYGAASYLITVSPHHLRGIKEKRRELLCLYRYDECI